MKKQEREKIKRNYGQGGQIGSREGRKSGQGRGREQSSRFSAKEYKTGRTGTIAIEKFVLLATRFAIGLRGLAVTGIDVKGRGKSGWKSGRDFTSETSRRTTGRDGEGDSGIGEKVVLV